MLVEVDETQRVRNWRQEQLERAGFSGFAAFQIGIRLDVDYHRAIEMLAHGATETLVIALLVDDD